MRRRDFLQSTALLAGGLIAGRTSGHHASPSGTGEPAEFPPDFLWGAATAAYQIEGASREALVEGLKRHGHRHVLALESPAALPALIATEAREGDLVVCLGAGDITSWAYALPGQLAALGK